MSPGIPPRRCEVAHTLARRCAHVAQIREELDTRVAD